MIMRLKKLLRDAADALVRRIGPFSRRGDSFNIVDTATWAAALDSADYYARHMRTVPTFKNDLELFGAAIAQAPEIGLVLEFGVASGRTINHIASLTSRTIHGFDAFKGLPEPWRTGFDKGAFAQDAPKVADNVRLHVGYFDDTLPKFLRSNPEPIAFIHVDCDLYSSTSTILTHLGSRIQPGAILVFDEYFNFPGWREDEWKAFQEFIASSGRTYAYVGFVPDHQQVAVVIDPVAANAISPGK